MKIVNKLSGFIVLVAMIGTTCMPLVSCEQPVNVPVNKPGDVDAGAAVVNISEVSEWDWLLAAKDGSTMLFDVDETTGMPTRLYLKPADEAVENGITFMFKENGLPDVIECNGYLLYFENFNGYTFDLAVIAPDGSVEYHFGIETDKDFDAWDAMAESGGARSVYGGRSVFDAITGGFSDDPVGSALDVLGFLLDIGTCVAAVFFPPLAIGCITGVISFVLDMIIFHISYFLEEEFAADMSSLSKDGLLLVKGALDCVKAIIGKDLDLGAWLDCIGAFIGAASLIVGVVQDLIEHFTSGKKAEVKAEMTPPPSYSVVNFNHNGGSGAVPASQRVVTGTAITLPSVGGLYRSGYHFIGWGRVPEGGHRNYNTNDNYTISGNTSFYALWRENLAAPTGLTATAASSSSITVSWDPVPGADEYYVYRSTSISGTYDKVGTSDYTLYVDDGLSANTIYYYKVSYYLGNYGESLLSGSESAVTMRTGSGTDVTFIGLTADGSGLITTTALTLTFSAAIDGLSADDLTLFGVEGVEKGALGGSGPAYTLDISGFSETGTVSVSVLKAGYNISESL
jgi:uncharacterized membrane protein YqaE (UPF0057 family)